MSRLSKVFLTSNTGINQYHKRHFPTAAAGEAFFLGKGVWDGANLSAVHNKEGIEGNCVHLPIPQGLAEACDYLCYKNNLPDGGVLRVNRITKVDVVNKETCAVYYEEDAWNTWVGTIDFGYCWVERQHPKEDNIGDYNISEPINPTLYEVNISNQLSGVNSVIKSANSSMGYYLFLSSDTYDWNNGLSAISAFGIYRITSGQFYGDIAQVLSKLGSFVKGGWTKEYTQPIFANMARLVYAPKAADRTGIVSQSEKLSVNPTFKAKWNKAFMPQFYRLKLIAQSTGQATELTFFDRYNSGEKSFNYMMELSLLGQSAPYWNLVVRHPSSVGEATATNGKVRSLNQVPYPEIECFGMLRDNFTALGHIKSSFGAVLGNFLSPTGLGSTMDEGRPTNGNVVEGVKSGVKAAFDNFEKDQQFKQYYHTGTQDGAVACKTGRMEYSLLEVRPTAEALIQIEDFFESYGYRQMRRLKLELSIRGNFTFTKTLQGACFTSQQAPAWAIREITEILERGITVWNVEIGSTKECG